MTAQALSDFINVSKYAQYLAEEQRRETPKEAGARMFDMHRRRYPQALDLIDEAQRAFDAGKILGSQRALQFGGLAAEKKHARLFNCVGSYCDRQRFFQEAFWLLLCGCGTGFSVQRHHVAKFPPISRPMGNGNTRTFVIPDTIEGWADSAGALLDSYFHPEKGAVEFDPVLIRPEGSPLSSGGRAPGPGPLLLALTRVRRVLESRVDEGFLRPIDAYDVVMHLSDAVLSGGIRRSSAICIFSADDEEMMRAKTGNWLQENPQRARSNNSALLLRGETSRETFDFLMACAREGGDPGMYWSSKRSMIPNPCGEVGFMPSWRGESGWQFCCLSTVNMEACRTPMDFLQAARAAAIVGTLQAGYTDFEYLGPVTEAIVREEALLGVSMTGTMRNPDLAFDPNVLRTGAREVLEVNETVANLIGINPAARATCLKPEGTGSLKLKTSCGMTPDHARRYLRHVQVNRNEPPAAFFKSINPEAVEPSSWSASGTDDVMAFCINAPEGALTKADVTALELLERVKLVKENWVDVGKRPGRCLHPGLSHNVSNTIHMHDDEWGPVADYIFEHQHTFAGVTLLSASADLDYHQAPFVAVKTEEEILNVYGRIFSEHEVQLARDMFGDIWGACDAGYADTFDVPRGRADYCLKDSYLLYRWRRLRRVYRSVDYRQMREEENNVRFEAEAACAGGVCEI